MTTRLLRTSLLLLLLLAGVGCMAQPASVETPLAPAATTLPSTATATPQPLSPAVATATLSPLPTATAVPFAPPDLRYLGLAFDEALAEFPGLASYSVIDLTTGQQIERNGDVAISGMSIVKVPILLEAYRVWDDAPTPAQTKLLTETATLSGNYTANLLLAEIAGQPAGGLPAAFAGAAQVTQELRMLDLYNTFIAVPYDAEPDGAYLSTYATPANQRSDLTTNPDSSMQTTTADMAALLELIYECSQGAGRLRELYGERLTAQECRALLEMMTENNIDAFLEAGVPAGVPVAHKHGWVGETHGDAGIILAPKSPYVMVVALHEPGWLEWADSTVLIETLSRLAYNHFTNPDAYTEAQLAVSLPPQAVPSATPTLPQARVSGTGGAGLTLRDSPGGAELLILPEGMRLYLLPEEQAGWRQVQTPDGDTGWVGGDFLALSAAP